MRRRDEKGRWIRQPIEERFWENVEKLDGEDACWRWTGQIEWTGYGRLTDFWQKVSAHRLSYTMHIGPIPADMLVCHRCDNRWCVRPDHFFLGTQADNLSDMHAKGRHRVVVPSSKKGEANPIARLTDAEVREIRETYRKWPITYRQLAKAYGVSFTNIGQIITRKSWSHLD